MAAKEVASNEKICEVLKQLVYILGNPRRERIIKALPTGSRKTFEMLKAETGISTGVLHHQLELLKSEGYVARNDKRPAEWSRTLVLDELIDLAAKELQRSYQTKSSEIGCEKVDTAV